MTTSQVYIAHLAEAACELLGQLAAERICNPFPFRPELVRAAQVVAELLAEAPLPFPQLTPPATVWGFNPEGGTP